MAKPVPSGEVFFNDLKGMPTHVSPSGHASDLPHSYKVSLETTSGHLDLNLRRNARDPREYWVDYPKYHATSPIAEMGTGALDRF